MIRRAAIAALLAALAVPGAARAQCSTSGAVSICITPPSSVTGTVLLQPTSTAGNPSRVTYTLDGRIC